MILGDLTDAKDNHSAELVNRVVRAINSIPVEEINILVGNHDWLKSGQEYFRFLSILPNVNYITQPCEDKDVKSGRPSAFYLPYSKNPGKDWKDLDFSHYQYLFMHQTRPGAVASNGQKMDGEELPELNAGKIYSGDIHVPQVCGPLEYVGSPYHVHFGDAFTPRCVLLEKGGRPVDLHFKTISRLSATVSSFEELTALKLRNRDQIKLTFELNESEKHEWLAIKRKALCYLESQGIDVHGLKLVVKKAGRRFVIASNHVGTNNTPVESIERFVAADELGGDVFDVAMEILES